MLEAIGLLSVILFVIWVVDLIFFKEERENVLKQSLTDNLNMIKDERA